MGTISEKLTYLNDTKTKLKNVINYSGANITNDTFRSYPEKLYDKFVDFVTNGTDSLYSSLPKVTEENTELTLNNTASGVLKLDFKGNTSQKSTSGKNKYNINDLSKNNCNYEISDTSIIITATGTYAYIERKIDNLDITKQYILSFIGDNASWITILDENKNKISETYGAKARIFTPTTTTTYVRIYATTSGSSGEKTFTEIQVEEGTTRTDFESFTNGPSPNPDYPQQIHVVTGDNDVKIENKVLFNANQNSYTFATNHTAHQAIGTIDLVANQTYYYSYTVENDTSTNVRNTPSLQLTGGTRVYQSSTTNYNTTKGRKVWEFTPDTTGTYIVGYWVNTPDVALTISDFMISTSSDIKYQTHQEQTYRVDFGGKNKVDFNNASYVAANYATVTKNGELYTVENGSSNSGSVRFENIDLLLKPNTTYTVSALIVSTTTVNGSCVYVSPGLRVEGTSVFGNRVGAGERSYVTFTTPNTLSTGNISLNPREANATAVFTDIMIEENTEATRYSRYVENPIEMCEIGEYEDKLFKNTTDNPLYNADLELNKWYKYGVVGKVVLDGSETWNYQYTNGWNTNIDNLKQTTTNTEQPYVICDYYTKGPANTVYNWDYGIAQRSNYSAIIIKNKDIANTTALKTWLSTHNIIVYYVLTTPTYTLLDDTLQEQLDEIYYNAVSCEDQTNISQTNADLPFVIGASAIRKYSE